MQKMQYLLIYLFYLQSIRFFFYFSSAHEAINNEMLCAGRAIYSAICSWRACEGGMKSRERKGREGKKRNNMRLRKRFEA
jgi:hypothetical protein